MRKAEVCTFLSLLFVSAAVLLFELSLLRSYAYLSYYHFGFLIISLALLGFALSGVILHGFYERLVREHQRTLDLILALFVPAVPLSLIGSDFFQLDVLAFNLNAAAVPVFLAHVLCVLAPFLLGALYIGLVLTVRRNPGIYYGCNLIGSGLGGATAIGVLYVFSPEAAPMTALFPAAAALAVQAVRPDGDRRGRIMLVVSCLLGIMLVFARVKPAPDQYKAVSAVRMLEAQGEADLLETVLLPSARIDAYSSDRFHSHLFAGLKASGTPPPQIQLFHDGNTSGTIFLPRDGPHLDFLFSAPQSLAYRIIRPASVLVFGERGNTSIYTAGYAGARKITVVQPTAWEHAIVENLSRGAPVELPRYDAQTALALQYLRSRGAPFNLVHLAGAEGLPSTGTGMEMLTPEPLLTVEGFEAVLSRLSTGGALTITRGIRLPPRDNIRILATALQALERAGAAEPSAHIAAARNHLAVTTMIFVSEISGGRSAEIAAVCDELGLEIIHLPHYRPDPSRGIRHQFPPAPGTDEDWFRYSAREMIKDLRKFFNTYPYDISPRSIDSPYFHFFQRNNTNLETDVRGGYSPASPEAAFRIIMYCLMTLAAVGLPLVLFPSLPAFRLRGSAAGDAAENAAENRGRIRAVFIYSLIIGIAFMLLEYTLLSRFALLLGHTVLGASAVISAFLIFAGLGSMTVAKPAPLRCMFVSGISAALIILLMETGWNLFTGLLSSLGPKPRFFAAMAMCGPPAFFMGRMFPSLMRLLRAADTSLIPYAWGVNGFASVLTGPLSMLLFLYSGYRAGALIAAALYFSAVFVSRTLLHSFSR